MEGPHHGGRVATVLWQIFWLILAVGALVMLIPVARQVFKRSDDD